jgi:cation transport ATPase
VGKDAVEPEASSRPGANGDAAWVELVVGGMHCQSCAALIEETLVRDHRVRTATVDLDRARASVVFDASALSVDALCAAVISVGYQATPVTSGDQAP